jgi:hypothetical protein
MTPLPLKVCGMLAAAAAASADHLSELARAKVPEALVAAVKDNVTQRDLQCRAFEVRGGAVRRGDPGGCF